MGEENRIMREIDNVIASTSDKVEAEKIVLEKICPFNGRGHEEIQ